MSATKNFSIDLIAANRGALRSATALGRVLTVAAAATALTTQGAMAGPDGGVVKAGSATITTRGGTTTINQSGQKVVIDWKSFDIDAGEAVNFLQPGKGSIALNRVLNDLPTHIRGQLTANGNIWIVNQHGVTFHAGAVVNVGSLIATTADIDNADFMAGNYKFDKPGDPNAKIINEGDITFGEAGLAAFVAPSAANRGVIAGKMGKVVIAGNETFAIDLAGDGMWAFTMGEGANAASASNSGRIHNPGGYILISARAAQGMVDSNISVGGVVEATTAKVEGGKIVLSGDGFVEVSGSLDATGAEAGQVGGSIEVTGDKVHVTATANVDASGDAGGGSIKIGGDYQGGGVLKTASRTLVSEGAEINASAIGQVGDGGEVIVWADEITGFFGSIRATGGANAGDGGFAELSGKQQLAFDGMVDLSARNGLPGELLLDPEDIIITSAAGANDGDVLADGEILAGESPGDTFTISGDAIEMALQTASVTIAANNSITQNADAPIDFQMLPSNLSLQTTSGPILLLSTIDAGMGGLTLNAGGGLTISGAIASAGALDFDAGSSIILNSAISSTGGDVSLTANSLPTSTVTFGSTVSGVDVDVTTTASAALGSITATGSLTVTSDGAISDGASTVLDIGGDVNFTAIDEIQIARQSTHTIDGEVTLDAARINEFAIVGGVTFGDVTTTDGSGAVNVLTSNLGALAVNGAISIAGDSDLYLRANGLITQTGSITADQLQISALQPVALTGANDINSLITVNNIASLAFNDIDDVDLAGVTAGALTITAGGDVTDSAVTTVTTGTSVTATNSSITLNETGSTFGTLALAGGEATVRNITDLELGDVNLASLTLDITGTLTQAAMTSLTVTASTSITATEDILLANTANLISGDVVLSGEDINLDAGGDITLGAMTASAADADQTVMGAGDVTISGGAIGFSGALTGVNDLMLTATGAISQSAAVIIAGDLDIDAAGQNVTLANTSNDFTDIAIDGAVVSVGDVDDLALGVITASNLTVNAGGAVSDTAASTVGTATSITATGSTIVLDEAASTFGALSLTANEATVQNVSDPNFGDVDVATLTVDVTGTVKQQTMTSLTVTADTSITATEDILLANTTNAIAGNVTLSGEDINLDAGGNITLGAITASAADADQTIMGAGDVTISGGTVAFGGALIGVNDLDVIATADINQTTPITISGDADLQASAAQINLNYAANDFQGRVDATASAVTLYDSTDLQLGLVNADTLVANAIGDITDDGVKIEGRNYASFTAGDDINIDTLDTHVFNYGVSLSADQIIRFAASGTLGLSSVSATNMTDVMNRITATGGMTLDGAVSTAGLSDLTLDTTNGDITQNAGMLTTDVLTLNLGTGDGVFNALANDINTLTAPTAGYVSLADADGVTLGDIDAATLTVFANDVIDQVTNSSVTLTGLASLTTTGDVVRLAEAGNDFASVTVFTNGIMSAPADVAITDANGVEIGNVNAASLTIIAGGDVTQTETTTILATGTTTLTVTNGGAALEEATNDFATVTGTADAIALRDANGITLGALAASAGSVTVSAAGDVTVATNANVTATDDVSLTSTLAGSTVSITGTSQITADSDVDADGDVTLRATGGSIAANSATAAISGANVTLDGGDVTASATITATAGGVDIDTTGATTLTGAVTATTAASTVTIDAGGDINVATIDAYQISAETTNGAVTQTGGTISTAASTVVSNFSGTGDVSLDQAGNNFQGPVALSGQSITIRDTNALLLDDVTATGTFTVNAGDAVTQNGTSTITAAQTATVTASGQIIDLSNDNDFQSTFVATGGDVSVTDTNAIELGLISAATLTVNAGGAVSQSASAMVTNSTTVTAIGQTVDLDNAQNRLTGAVNVTGGAVDIVNDGSIILGDVTASSLMANSTTGNITNAAADVLSVTGTTTLTAKGGSATISSDAANPEDLRQTVTIETGGAILVNGFNSQKLVLGLVDATAAPITIDIENQAIDLTGNVSRGGGGDVVTLRSAGDINQLAGEINARELIVSSSGNNVTLEGPYNDFDTLTLGSNGVVSVVTNANVAVGQEAMGGQSALTLKSKRGISQASSLTVTNDANFYSGGSTITLNAVGNAFGSVSADTTYYMNFPSDVIIIEASDTSISGVTARDATFTSSGSITQTGVIDAYGDSSFTATGDITLTNAANDFADAGSGYTAAFSGGTISVTDVDTIALGNVVSSASTTITADDAGASGNFSGGLTELRFFDTEGDMVLSSALVLPATVVEFTADSVGAIDAQALSLPNANTLLDATTSVTFSTGPGTFASLTVNGPTGIYQSAPITVTGETDLNAPMNTIELGDAANDFQGRVDAEGSAVTLYDANNLELALIDSDTLIANAGGDITDQGAQIEARNFASFTAGDDIIIDTLDTHVFTGNVDLSADQITRFAASGSVGFSSITATNMTDIVNRITVTDGMTFLGDVSTAGLSDLTLDTTNGNVTQNLGTLTTDVLTLNIGTGDATLQRPMNDINTLRAPAADDISLTDVNGVTIGSVDATTLTVNAGAAIDQEVMSTITLDGLADLTTTGANITLSEATNDFATIDAEGADLTFRDANGVELADIDASGALSVEALNGAITDGDAVATPANSDVNVNGTTTLIASGAITLDDATNDFVGAVAADGTAITLRDANNIILGDIDAGGALVVDAVAGAISQDGDGQLDEDINAAAEATFTASTTIALTDASNDFEGAVSAAGTDVSLNDLNAIELADIDATNLIVSANSIDDGAAVMVADGDVDVTGTATLTARTGDITLDDATNNFGVVSADGAVVTLTDRDAIELANIDATTLVVTAGSIDDGDAGMAGEDVNVTGTTTLTASATITLDDATNDFVGIVAADGTAITLRDANNIILGDIDAGGVLIVDAVAGAISQDGDGAVGGDIDAAAATFTASTTITLIDASNDFEGAVNAAGMDVSLNDLNAIELADIDATNLIVTANSIDDGAAVMVADGDVDVTGTATLTARTGDITLDDATNNFGVVNADGAVVTLTDRDAIELANIDVTTLVVTAGSIDDGDAGMSGEDVNVTGTTTLTASTTIMLDDATNDFGGAVAADGTEITLRDANNIILGDIDAGGALIVDAVAGAISQDGDGQLDEDINAAAQATFTASTTITLTDTSNDFEGTVNAAGTDVSLNDLNALELADIDATTLVVTAGSIDDGDAGMSGEDVNVTGTTTLTASTTIMLDDATNDFGGAVAADGTAITLRDANDIILGDIDAGGALIVDAVAGAISQDGDGQLDEDINAAAEATFTASTTITLTDTSNDFEGTVNAAGTDVSLNDLNALELADIDATNLIVSAGSIDDGDAGMSGEDVNVTGATTLTASTTIMLDDATNDFGGAVAADGTAIMLRDANSIILGDIDASGVLVVDAVAGAISQDGDGQLDEDINADAEATFTASTTITLTDASNDFEGAVNAAGTDVSLNDLNAIELADLDATNLIVTAGTIDDGDAGMSGEDVNVTGAMMLTASATITLDDVTNDFGGAVAADGTAITLRDANNITLGDIDAGGALIVDAVAGAISQDGDGQPDEDINAAANATFTASTTITLTDASNDFEGAVNADGTAVAINDLNALELGDIDAMTLAVTAGTSIDDGAEATTNGDVNVTGTTTLTALGDITLNDAANNFGLAVSADGGSITLRDADNLILGQVMAGGSLTVTAAGAITDSAASSVTVTGATTLTTGGAFDIALDNDTAADRHDFRSVVNATGQDITLIDRDSIILGTIATNGGAPDDTINVDGGAEATDPGELIVRARGGAITQEMGNALTITGDATLEATDGAGTYFDITLTNTLNAFDSDGVDATGDKDALPDSVTFLGETVTINDTGPFFVFDSVANAGGVLTSQTGGLVIERLRVNAANGPLVGIALDGAIDADDLSGGSITLGGAGSTDGAATAASGVVIVDDFSVDALAVASDISTTLTNGDAGAALEVAAPLQTFTFVTVDAFTDGASTDFNAVTGSVADQLILERMAFVGDITIAAGDVDLGHINAADGFFVTALTGDIEKRADTDLDLLGAQAATFTVTGARDGMDETVMLQSFDKLVDVGGASSFTATSGDVVITRSLLGGAKEVDLQGPVSIAATDAALEDQNSLVLGQVDVDNNLAIRINTDNAGAGTETLTQTESQTVTIGGDLALITGVGATDRSDVTLANAGNSFNNVSALAGNLSIRGADAFTLRTSDLTGGLTIGSAAAQHGGDLTLQDVQIEGDLAFDAIGAVTLSRLDVGGAAGVAGSAGNGLNASDLRVDNAVDLATTGGDLSVTDAIIGAFDFDSAGTLTVTNLSTAGSQGNLSTAVGDITVANIVSNTNASFDSTGGALDIDSARIGSTLTISANGDVTLGAIATGDDLFATSDTASVLIRDAATEAPADIVVDGVQAADIGFASGPLVGGAADERVIETVAGTTGQTVDPDDFTLQLSVGDDATFDAAGSVMLPREATAEGGLQNDFIGDVAISATTGDVVIEDANALSFATVTITAGDLSARSNADNTGAGEGITQTAAMAVGGAASFITGDHSGAAIADEAILADVTLTNAGNDFTGAVSVVANNASLIDANAITVANARLANDLSIANASTTPGDGATVSDAQTGGAASIDVAGLVDLDRLVVGGVMTATSRLAGVTANDLSVTGATSLTAATTLSLDDALLADATITAGASGALSDVSARVINVETGGVTISGLSATTTTITSTAAADIEQISTGSTTITTTDSLLALSQAEIAGPLTARTGAGAITLADVNVTGDAVIDGGAIGSDASGAGETRVRVTGALDLDGATVDLTDIAVLGATALDATGVVTLDDVSFADLALNSADAVTITDAGAATTTLNAGGALDVTNMRIGSLDADAVGRAEFEAVQITGDADILSTGADVRLGAVQVGGVLTAEAATGAITTFDGVRDLAEVTVSAPNAVALPGFIVEGPDTAEIGVEATLANSPADEGRVQEVLTAVADRSNPALGGGQAADTTLDASTNARLLDVTGSTTLTASIDLTLDDTDLADAALTAGGAGTLTTVTAETLSVTTGGALTASVLNAGDTTITSGGPTDLSDVASASTTITVADQTLAARRVETNGPLSIATGAGDIALADLNVTGDATISGATIGSDASGAGETRIAVGGALDLDGTGDVALTDLSVIGATTLDAGGTVALDDISLAAATITGGGDVTLTDGQTAATTVTSGGALSGTNLRAASLEATAAAGATIENAEIAGDTSLTATTGDIRLGSVEVGGVLTGTATTGAITTFDSDKTLDAATVAAPLDAATPSFGASTVDAASDVAIAASTNARLLDVTGSTTLTASTDLTLDDTDLADAALTAGGAGTLTTVTAETLSVTTGGALTASVLNAGDTTITSGGPTDLSDVATASTTITVADQTLAARRVETNGPLTIATGAGDIALADLNVTGDATISGANIGSDASGAGETRIAVGGALDLDGTGDVALTDLSVIGATALDAGGTVALDDISLAAATITGGGDVTLTDGQTAATTVTSGGALSGTNLRAASLEAAAVNDVALDAMRVGGNASILSTAGDIGFGSVAVAGQLTAESATGVIQTTDSDFALGPVTIAAPTAATVPSFGSNTAPAVSSTLIGDEVNATLLSVGGDAYFLAAGDIALVDDEIGVTGDNDFVGGVTAISGGSVILNDANDLILGAPTGVATPGGATFDATGVTAANSLRVEAGGSVTDADAPQAVLSIGGDALVLAGGDILLDNETHAIGGAIAATGRDITLTETGTIRLGPVNASGDLMVEAGANNASAGGSLGGGAILQDSTVTVANAAVGGVAATETSEGAITVAGASTFASGLNPAFALDDPRVTGNRDLVLANPANDFGGRLNIARIAGDATITENSLAGATAGVQEIGNFEIGGTTRLTTSDNIIFIGRMTALTDDVEPDALPTRPDTVAATGQGDLGVADADLRLFIASGESLIIDTTGGGVQETGADVRFDRPIDGDNDAPPRGDAVIEAERAGLAALTITGGSAGEVRFRDFVGAQSPLGAVDIAAGDIFAGFTFAEETPDLIFPDVTTDNRFLFDRLNRNDFFFAGSVRVNAPGRIEFLTPFGTVDDFILFDQYFGINVSNFTFGDVVQPATIQAFGFIGTDRSRAIGLLPIGPRGPDFQFNDCVIGDVADCTNIPIPNVINNVLIAAPPLLGIDAEDLLELFGSFGNEELWGVPQSYYSDIGGEQENKPECPEGSDDPACKKG